MSSSRIPQPGICINSPVSLSPLRRPEDLKWSSSVFRKRRGSGTLTIKQASSVFSSAEDAFEDVPAKEAGVRDPTSTKNVKLMDPVSPTQLLSTVHDHDHQLPSLLSMIIDGFPPLQRSKYDHEAKKRLQQYVELHQDVIPGLDWYCHLGFSAVSFTHPDVISVDRFVVMTIHCALLFLLDDFFFDTPDEFCRDKLCDISRDVRKSPGKIQEYLDHLDAIFSQEVQPTSAAPLIETLIWESGRDLLELSNSEWFNSCVAGLLEHHHDGATSHADIVQGHNSCFQDLESYIVMHAGNVGEKVMQLLIEFANDIFILSVFKANLYFENVITATSIYIGFANDVFSYHKESLLEQNPRNLITVMMECEGKPIVQTMHKAIGLVNTYARLLLDLEVEAWNSSLRNHLQGIKALIAANIYVSYVLKRYWHLNSIFPELRDMHD